MFGGGGIIIYIVIVIIVIIIIIISNIYEITLKVTLVINIFKYDLIEKSLFVYIFSNK